MSSNRSCPHCGGVFDNPSYTTKICLSCKTYFCNHNNPNFWNVNVCNSCGTLGLKMVDGFEVRSNANLQNN